LIATIHELHMPLLKTSREVRWALPGLGAWGVVLGGLLLAGLVCLAYWPAVHGDFLLDDDLLLTDNPLVKAHDGLYRMFTPEPVDYWPLTNSSFWVEWRLWGMNPTGYHVTNLLLHIAAALLVWRLLERLSIPGAFLAALLFALHPVNVESVAWIAQRKNTLSLCFFLGSLWAYVRAGGAVNRWYALSLLAFILAMLSKGSVAVLPLVLLFLAGWQRGRVTRRDGWQTVPFFAVAIALTWVNLWFQARNAGGIIRDVTWLERLLGAGGVIWFYLYKALLPIHLAFVYPQWNIQPSHLGWWLPLLATAAVTGLLACACRSSRQRNWARPVLWAWGLYIVALLPVLGFVDVGFMKHSLVADHYQYIALIPLAALLGAGWSLWQRQVLKIGHWAALAAAIILVGAFTVLTFRQCRYYDNAMALYQFTVDRNPDSWLGQNNLGLELAKLGRSSDAVQRYQEALRLNPQNAESYNGLGLEAFKQQQLSQAIAYFQKSLEIKSEFPQAHYNLASALRDSGQPDEAIKEYQAAVRLQPDYLEALNNLGNVLNRAGRFSEAIIYYHRAIHLNPDDAATHYNLGNALENSHRPAEAVEQYRVSLKLDPKDANAVANLASAYADLGRSAEAIQTAKKALEMAQAQGFTELAGQIEAWLKKNSSQTPPQSGN
jgi:tetratricopeptide (TPR) repeat protein